MTDTPWEPPLAGSEVEQIVGSLERLRATFRWKVDGLDEDGLAATVGVSALTLGGLLKHLAWAEALMFRAKLHGERLGPEWDDAPWDDDPDWEFTSAAADAPAELYARYDRAVAYSRAALDEALDDGGLDRTVHLTGPDGERVNLRRLVCDLVEEYGRHTGHADLIREYVDGSVGEDPPPGWRPQ
ncbi:DUF664 domain-containing protein [Actinomycetospora sp. OC33-EN08]|uniref:DUF664 domain-containing protein n=1 Tax=Actinomycetospora aurantiaca TaxID=3129233 RepID=A0ABU8MVV1_9PSEU